MEKISVNIRIKQTLLSRFLINLAMFLYFYKLINTQLYLQIIDMAILDIKSFKYRVGKSKWGYLNLKE